MKDFLNEAYELLKEDSFIKNKCENRIKFYEYPNYEDETKPFIVLRPLEAPTYDTYGSNGPIRASQIIQIDVQAQSRMECKTIMQAIMNQLIKKGWGRLNSNSLDTYFSEVKRYVLAYRFYFASELNEIDY